MLDDTQAQGAIASESLPRQALSGILQSKESGSRGRRSLLCRAFGYLRGIREHAAAVEFRFRDGNSTWFPYSWLGNLAVQSFRGPAAEILRGRRVPRAHPGQQHRPAAQ